jgi:alpha-D-ribose 1-methylphosphonate 5-triphosphate diphosphatase PhnM
MSADGISISRNSAISPSTLGLSVLIASPGVVAGRSHHRRLSAHGIDGDPLPRQR